MGSPRSPSYSSFVPKGALQLRRINITIRSKRNPDANIAGYMVLHELSNEILSFFSTKKFKHEEELEVYAEIHGSNKKYETELIGCHEQISSGRVMTSLPEEGQALPTRTFYRCFAKVKSLMTLDKPEDDEPIFEEALKDVA